MMTDREKDEIYEFWGQINACYGYQPNEYEAAIFETMVFNKYPLQEVKAAFEQHVCGMSGRSSEFAPKPSTILALLADRSITDAASALERVRNEVVRVGSHRVPNIDEPILVATILLLGGWTAVCQEMPDSRRAYEYEAYAKRFAAAHARAVREVTIKKSVVNRLAARTEESFPAICHETATFSRQLVTRENVTEIENETQFCEESLLLTEDNGSTGYVDLDQPRYS